MNIDEMEAGRELDALVAERVMGWHSYAMMGAHRFFPSTNIADAWEVVDKLRARGWYFEIETPVTSGGLYDVSVSIRDSKSGEWDSTGQMDRWITENVIATAAPLAICRAALKAVMREP